ncbi:MAG TPA: hypothetical protein VH813_04335 [Candidatus Limnocylindrales bacterium]
MSEPIYERYKEALRRGHVAALRGQLDDALVAYAEAGEIAPDRALPHTSRGSVLARLARREDALDAYAAALERSPRDEAALAGRADVLIALGRRVEAADTLDRLAECEEEADRTAEACDTARRALELAESRTRREHVERLAARLRAVPADELAVAAMEDAMAVLDLGLATTAEPPAAPGPEPDVPEVVLEPEPVIDRGHELTAEAEALVMGGDRAAARDRCLAAASSHRVAGRVDAAIDACYLGLSVVPGDLSLHLELAELYLERGWREPAAEKLLLLGRLVDLDADASAHRRLCAIVGSRFADDPRLTALCP